MKKIFRLILLTIVGLSTQQSIAQPSITTFTPASGSIGTAVTITGSNFNLTPANNIVFFGTTKANVSACSATSLTVTVPLGASYQPISVTNLSSGLTAYSALPFIVTYPCGGFINSSSFSTKLDFTTGTKPQSISTGDFDRDGRPDIAIANYASNTISLFRNTSVIGTISFATKVDFTTGQGPISVSTGDFDGDGKLDLAVANAISAKVSVFKNTSSVGTISFASKVDFTTGSGPIYVSKDDLDGDGKIDIAITNNNSGTVSIFRNTCSVGTISFAAKMDFITGTNPQSVTTGDLDGDNKSDLAIANNGSSTISIFKNNGNSGLISFASKIDYLVGTNPTNIIIAELDRKSVV